MSIVPKKQLREMIAGGNLKSAEDLHSFLKDLFKDTLQEMLEAELEVELGYSKILAEIFWRLHHNMPTHILDILLGKKQSC